MLIGKIVEVRGIKILAKMDKKLPPHILEVKGRISNGKFLGGLRLLPIVEAKIETLDKKDFEIIFYKPTEFIKIGKNLFDNSNDISLDINLLIPSHIGIFGNTGSGKSNTMSKILKEYIEKIQCFIL